MADLKPIGSEKLPFEDKIKRIMEIANYKETPKNTSKNDPTSTVHFIKESANGFFGVVREKDGYYVKHGLTESKLEYIGGMMMKNKNRFNSYAEAYKRLELIAKPLTEQEKKYVLNTNKTVDENPAAEDTMSDVPAPPADAPAPEADAMGGEGDMGGEMAPDAGMEGGEAPVDAPAPEGDPDLDAPMGGMSSEQLKGVQKLTGKLGQRLRAAAEILESDDIKYVINSILSAVDLEKLNPEDKEAIASRFEDDNDYDDLGAIDSVDGDNAEMGDQSAPADADIDDMGGEGDMGGGEELPPADDEEMKEEEFDDIYENFSRLEKALLGESKKTVKNKK